MAQVYKSLTSKPFVQQNLRKKHKCQTHRRSPPNTQPLLPVCKEMSRSITVLHSHKLSLGQRKPISWLQAASVCKNPCERQVSSTPLKLQCNISWKVKLVSFDYKSILTQTHYTYKNNLWYKKISTLCRRNLLGDITKYICRAIDILK
jgi:hypothetical protein